MNRRPRFATLATHVLDIRPIPNAAEDATGSKVTCEFEITDGGGGINVASQLQQMHEQVALVARVGLDDLGCVACSRLNRKFSDVLAIPVLPQHRVSILQQDDVVALVCQSPENLLQRHNPCLHDIQPAIAFAAAEEFARANADKILIGHAAVAAFTEVIFNSSQGTGTICNSEAAIGR